ncbi:DinB family protein [Rhodovulum sulfidophilum]|uniref:DinB family protein n=1 Tax=Rhodovulum sulfidophilum TaxID=35806 RepID=UPI001F208521|nr:DinB family protein [Rhodovulum sulfidophilum]
MGQAVVTVGWCRLMARYNRWQNRAMMEEVARLGAVERMAPRGAHWGSIQGTMAHLLWADHVWMSRLDGWEAPHARLEDSAGFVADWSEYRSKRQITDARISRWSQGLSEADLAEDLSWYSGTAGREMTVPRAICIVHMFNHQTHHRGQISAMLTAAGVLTAPTDLFLMPDLVG